MDKFIDKDGREVHIGVIGRGKRISIPTFDELAMALPDHEPGTEVKPNMVNLITEENDSGKTI